MPSADGTRVGQRLKLDPTKQDVPPELVDQTLAVASLVSKDGRFVTLKGPTGVIQQFGRPRIVNVEECLPATATVNAGDRPRIVEREKHTQMSDEIQTQVLNLATTHHQQGDGWDKAAKKAGAALLATEKKRDAYFGVRSTREPVVNLSDLPKLTADEIREELQNLAREWGCSAQEAAEIVICMAAAARFEERVMQLAAGGLDHKAAMQHASDEDREAAEHYRLSKLL